MISNPVGDIIKATDKGLKTKPYGSLLRLRM